MVFAETELIFIKIPVSFLVGPCYLSVIFFKVDSIELEYLPVCHNFKTEMS